MSIFTVTSRDLSSKARLGILQTAHGDVNTPVFMPVGTRGAVKGITPLQLKDSGASIVLANTYHMFLRPGPEIVQKLGGLHKLMAWDGPILTDSGGYQVFSLSTLNRIGEDGVSFSSHIDGAKFYLDAAVATRVQNQLGADIIMCFDECTHYPCDAGRVKKAVDRTIRWALQCKEAHNNAQQLLFGIVQGGTELDLRQYCAEKLIEMDFPGYAIGGLSVGEGHEKMVRAVDFTAPLLPENKPRYLMGVGMPPDIIAAVYAGVDMFDCVLPTRNGRNGYAFTEQGPVRMRNNVHSDDTGPVEAGCECYCCQNFTRGAVRHFFIVGEMLGPILLSIHNLRFYQRLMETIREKIGQGVFGAWAPGQIKKYQELGFVQSEKTTENPDNKM